ncbi:hypothetical protein AB0N99_31000 [Streptomyces sp. NPDC093272]|uniref:hypothetical protein n=1 Tax=Streptomyces sp. NPDC093272 TaxID=3154981 RepID=UPI00343EE7D8
MPTYRIFGRQPAAVLAFVSILVKLASAYVFHASDNQQATVNTVAACIVALLIAISAHDSVGAAIFNLAQALVAAAVGFGLKLDADHQALWLSLVSVAVGLWSYTQVTAPKPPAPLTASRGPASV